MGARTAQCSPPVRTGAGAAKRSGWIVLHPLGESMPDVEERLIVVELAVGAQKAETGPDEGPLRSDVVQSRVGDDSGQSVVGRQSKECDDRLCGVAVATGRGSQAVADLDAAAFWLALKADPPDGPPVEETGDPVVAERLLLSVLGGRAKEASHCTNVAFEGEIVRPRISRPSTSSEDAFTLCDIDRVQ